VLYFLLQKQGTEWGIVNHRSTRATGPAHPGSSNDLLPSSHPENSKRVDQSAAILRTVVLVSRIYGDPDSSRPCPKSTSMHWKREPPIAWNRPTQNTAPYIDAMAAHKLPGEAARYNKLLDHDIDGDSEHSEHPASGTDADTPTSVAARSIVRRRRQEPRPFQVKAMSLVGLKNLFFKQTVTAIPKRAQPSREYGMNGTVLSTPTDSLEAGIGSRKGRTSARLFYESFH
jgi:hypothetical protein